MSAVPNPIIVPMTVSIDSLVVPMTVATNTESVGMETGFVVVSGLSPHYAGEYEFAPTAEQQTIAINGMIADADIIIDPIPSNYGLITWNGLGIRVS